MLRDEMELYTKLTGEDAAHVPIIKIGAYLDGYEKGTEVLDKIRAEIEKARNTEIKEFNESTDIVGPTSYQRGSHEGYDEAIADVLQIIDKYKSGGSKEA